MNNVTKFVFALIVIPLIALSCDPAKEFKTELDDIDAHLVHLDSLENLLDGIDFDSLTIMVEHVKSNEAEIKELYTPDTLNETFGRQMNDCKAIRKNLGNVGKDESLYGDELNAIKHQFLDLKDDIKNGVLSKEQITEYVAVEKAAMDKVSLSFGSFYNMVSAERYRYHVVVPKVDAFIAELKTKNDELD
ncbi:MAG: hypothetical protein GQ574_24150 [Crocinitomix sp.]|nr:hypothetical protein [Crocinitomix sp.]